MMKTHFFTMIYGIKTAQKAARQTVSASKHQMLQEQNTPRKLLGALEHKNMSL